MKATALGLLFVAGLAQAAPPLTAQEAYGVLTAYRDRHDDVVWNGKAATPAELRAVVADLEDGLRRMDDPTIHDLAEGDVYLRFRRYNLLVDLAKVQARRGDAVATLAAVRQLAAMQWSGDMGAVLREDPNVRAVLARHPAPDLDAIETLMRRFGDDGVLASNAPPTEGQRIAGLARIWSVARDGFAWFDHVPDLDWDRRFSDVAPRVARATDEAAYYRELMRFVAALRDGHSNVYVPERLAGRFNARPGIRTRRVEGRVLVTDIATNLPQKAAMHVGDEVIAIDGRPVADYAEAEVAPYQSSSTPQDLEVRTYRYALLSGAEDRPVVLNLRDRTGRAYTVTLARALSGFAWAPAPEPFRLRADGIAVLDVRQLENDSATKALEAHLDALKKAKGLVLDLRGNGGGSTQHGLAVLSWLQREPIPLPIARYRESTPYRFAGGAAARTEWRTLKAETYQRARPWVFDGPVVMLVNAGTFSAGEDMAAAFRLARRGTIVGSATGGSTGQPYAFALPGGGRARICVKRDLYPDGTSFVGTGVLPDRSVLPTVTDIRDGRDRAMDLAVDVIRSEPAHR